MKKNISYLTVFLLLIVSVLYSSHSAFATVCDVNCDNLPTSTPFPFPTIVFPTIDIPFPTSAFPTPTECPITPTPQCNNSEVCQASPTPTPAPTITEPPTATPTPRPGLTHTEGNQGDGKGDGLSSSPGRGGVDTGGQVLGLASAGTFVETVMQSLFVIGLLSLTFGVKNAYATQKKS